MIIRAQRQIEMPKVVKFDHKPLTTQEMHDLACAYGEEQFSRYGECKPTWLINLGQRTIWVETLWRTDAEKYDITDRLSYMMQALGAQAYTLAVEAWVAVDVKQDDGKPPKKFVMPSERPENERDDILMVITQPKFGPQLMTRYLVTIRKTGLNFLGPRADETYEKGGGDMTDLLHRKFD